MNVLTSLLLGFLFASGLALSGMTDPRRVLGFLDLFGRWDPTLAFVMAGAVSVYFIFSRIVLRRRAPVLVAAFVLPARGAIDAKLITGAALFGVGWGLAGYCPGPALVSLAPVGLPALVFTAAMLGGALAFLSWSSRRIPRKDRVDETSTSCGGPNV